MISKFPPSRSEHFLPIGKGGKDYVSSQDWQLELQRRPSRRLWQRTNIEGGRIPGSLLGCAGTTQMRDRDIPLRVGDSNVTMIVFLHCPAKEYQNELL